MKTQIDEIIRRYVNHVPDYHVLGMRSFSERIEYIANKYNEPHRFFHNLDHIKNVMDTLTILGVSNPNYWVAALFHDIIYFPTRGDNEARSRDYFLSIANTSAENKDVKEICNLIMATCNHDLENADGFVKPFLRADLMGLFDENKSIVDDELSIFKEYQMFPISQWRAGRLNFLKKWQGFPTIQERISFVENFHPNIGVFTGTFNKFHKGHMDVLERSEEIFDKVIIVQAINPDKTEVSDNQLNNTLPFHEVVNWKGLVINYMQELRKSGCRVSLIRGFRNGQDIPYEMQLLRFMRDSWADMPVVLIPCDSRWEHISSSMLRQLVKFGQSDENYLPNKYDYAKELIK